MTKRIERLLLDSEEILENMDIILEVIDEITNDGKGRKLLPYDLKIKEIFTENIKFVTDYAKKTGDYSSLSSTDIKILALAYQIDKEITKDRKRRKKLPHDLKIKEPSTENIKLVTDIAKKTGDYTSLSPTDIKVLALAYQIEKEMEMEDDLMMEPIMQKTELPNHTSNPEIKDDANEHEEFTIPNQTEPPKQSARDGSKINILGAGGAKQGADGSVIKNEGSDAVHLDNCKDQKLADIAELIKKTVLRDGYDVDHFKPDKYTDDEDSDSDVSGSDCDTDGEHPHNSSEKLAEKKGNTHGRI